MGRKKTIGPSAAEPRRRGRPRKAPATVPSAKEPRRRGRPRKNPAAGAMAITDQAWEQTTEQSAGSPAVVREVPAPATVSSKPLPEETAAPPAPIPEAPAKGADLLKAEHDYAKKYPDSLIVEGSLAPAGVFPEFGHKRTIVIECTTCGAPRRLATSDLHHVRLCRACKAQRREARKKAKAGQEGKP